MSRMNPEAVMAALHAQLSAALTPSSPGPGRVVTRDLIPFDQQQRGDREAGILTLVSTGIRYQRGAGRDVDAILTITAIFELTLPEKHTGKQIEQAEFALYAELRDALDALPARPCLEIVAMRQSAQIEKPEAWIQVDLEHRETEL